jgi:hypothetical protein
MMRYLWVLVCLGLLTGCVQNPIIVFVPSTKSAVELRVAQVRVVPGDPDDVMRGVIGTLHDLGYRIIKAEPGAGTVSATRQTTLRMAVVVRKGVGENAVIRANATIVSLAQESQVDSPEFYRRDFFLPLEEALHRQLALSTDDTSAPEAVRPIAELNSAKERESAAARAAAPAHQPSPTETKKL